MDREINNINRVTDGGVTMSEQTIELLKSIYNVDTNDGLIRQVVLDYTNSLHEYTMLMDRISK